jgi:hypothetical protein
MQATRMDLAQTEFYENKQANRSYFMTLADGTILKGKPYRDQPADPFFVVWLESGRVECVDFQKLVDFSPMPETRKSRILKPKPSSPDPAAP